MMSKLLSPPKKALFIPSPSFSLIFIFFFFFFFNPPLPYSSSFLYQ